MSCVICELPIESTDKKTEMYCCDLVLHTKCCIDRHSDTKFCLCGHNLFPFLQHHMYNVQEQNEVIPDTPEFNEKVKALKTQINQYKKLKTPLNKKVKEESLNFKEMSIDLINQVRTLKTNSMDAIEKSDEYKNLLKQRRKTKTSLTRLVNEYKLSNHYVRSHLIPNRNILYEMRYDTILWGIKRQLRIKPRL